MKSIVLTRFKQDDYQTIGELVVYDNDLGAIFSCKTLELPWKNNQKRISRIPSNHYEVIKHQSPKFGNSLWIKNVPDRSEILIHVGNFIGNPNPKTGKPDSLGCPLVGEKFNDPGNGIVNITNSRTTINKLYEFVEEPIYINIIDNFK